ncbi:MAG TPA: HEAT repeat domain-containing protein [Methylomirabilota bacterium]|nr:HEAT repeat domain-containing protein [Methylomirabilota bacterium]
MTGVAEAQSVTVTTATTLIVVAESRQGPPTTPFSLEVQYDRATDLISIKSREAPLDTVLQEIAKKTDLTMSSPKKLPEDRVSVEINRVRLEHALRRLLEGFNSIFIYGLDSNPARSAPNEAPTPRLATVTVLSRKVAEPVEARALQHQSTDETKSPHYGGPAVRDPAEMLRALIEGGADVARGIANALREPSREQERERLIEALLERLDNGSFFPADGVLAALKELAPERAADALVKQLQGTDPRMRAIAAAALGRLGDERAIEPLLPRLGEDDETVRRVAASSLALIGGRRAMDELLQAFVAGENRIRYPVSVAIASFGDERSQKAIAKLIAGGLALREPTAEEAGVTNPNAR